MIGKLSMFVSKVAGRTGLVLGKNSPTILVATGVLGLITAGVMASRSSLRYLELRDEHIDKMLAIKDTAEVLEPRGTYTVEDQKSDKLKVYGNTALELVKMYGPSVLLATASVACIFGGHKILNRRNLAVMAAYKAVAKSFEDYRKRVVEEFGIDKDRLLKNGILKTKVDVLSIDDKGKETMSEHYVETTNTENISQYARFFDESCLQWSKSPEYNLTFLKCQQSVCNDLLKARGHVFLNEVYDMLGLQRSQAGAVVGWVKGEGDDTIDFGLFDGNRQPVRDFVNGYERSILLDFNVDGIIYDLI